jgi:hypothetical protein
MNKQQLEHYNKILIYLKDHNNLDLLGSLNELLRTENCSACVDLSGALIKANRELIIANRKIQKYKKLRKEQNEKLKQLKQNQRPQITEFVPPKKLTILKDEDGPNDFAHALQNSGFNNWGIE